MNTVIVIPARMDSERLPGKPMLMAGGKPLVHWTYDRARRTKADRVIVATPDDEIAVYCQENGLEWRPTLDDTPTGTLRCLEATVFPNPDWTPEWMADPKQRWKEKKLLQQMDVLVNWQVDEPLVEPSDVDRLIEVTQFVEGSIQTLVWDGDVGGCGPKRDLVKVVTSGGGWIRWFSRATLFAAAEAYHCGVYAFPAKALGAVKEAGTTVMSRAESLEQLAWLEAGLTMRALRMDRLPLSVNTPADWEEFKGIVEEKG